VGRICFFALVVATAGCDYTAPRLSFAVEQRILRETTLDDLPTGQATAGDAIVRVTRTGRAAGSCSGAMIGPRHVLTAEHCMMKLDATRELTSIEIVPGDVHVELGGDYLPWGRVGVREVHGCPGYMDDIEHDVAVLVLSRPVPGEVPILELSFAIPDMAGVFELGGFGTNVKPKMMPDTDWMITSTTRHLHTGPIVTANAGFLAVRIPGAPGDSGGPIVDTANGRIIGVVSRGRTDAAAKDGDRGGPLVAGPRLLTCKKTIEEALAR
jgi:secreted trypsin-like serine protease